jgi:hypothetical protein
MPARRFRPLPFPSSEFVAKHAASIRGVSASSLEALVGESKFRIGASEQNVIFQIVALRPR